MSSPFRWDVLGLGCVAVDDLLYLEEFPAPDSKIRLHKRVRSCGGLTATALVAAARLGAHCAFAGVLGDDEDSRYVLDSFRREGIDVSPLVHRSEARPIHSTIIVAAKEQTRTILFDLAGSTGADPQAPSAEVIRASRVLLVDHYGIEGMTRAARIARESGVAIVADLERSEWPGFHELLAVVDHLIVSESFALRLTRTKSAAEAVSLLWSAERQLVAVTCGADGLWFRSAGGEVGHVEAYSVRVVDTTGCGDVFHGVYAAALAKGKNVIERLRLASAAAALKAARGEGHLGIPSRQEVEAFLANAPKSMGPQ